MNINRRVNNRFANDDAVASRLAVRFAGALTARAENLPHDVSERLRFAREQAMLRARQARLAVPAAASGAAVVGVSSRGAATLAAFMPWWQRAASVLPVAMLLAGLVLINHWSLREQVVAAADIDTQLLSDDLPPAAYSDPGFAEYLRTAPATASAP